MGQYCKDQLQLLLAGAGQVEEATAVCPCCRETSGCCRKALDAALMPAAQQLAFALQCSLITSLDFRAAESIPGHRQFQLLRKLRK